MVKNEVWRPFVVGCMAWLFDAS